MYNKNNKVKKSEIIFTNWIFVSTVMVMNQMSIKIQKPELMKTYVRKIHVLIIAIIYKNLNHSFKKIKFLKKNLILFYLNSKKCK